MKQDSDKIRYGIYIDRKHAFIFALGGQLQVQILSSETIENPGEVPRSTNVNQEQQVHVQNEKNEQLRKFCRLIIDRIENPLKIMIFGPSMSKFELQKEVMETRSLKHVEETLKKSDVMTKEEAQRFVLEYYSL